MHLWDAGNSGAQLEGLYTVLVDYVGSFIPAVRKFISFSDYEI
jgi:hypothetical protein